MNIEKQIKEMADFLWRCTPVPNEEMCSETAEDLCNAGYRKASDVAREIIADLDNGIDEYLKFYSRRRNEAGLTDNQIEYTDGKIDAYCSVKFRLAELKKKYTEEK